MATTIDEVTAEVAPSTRRGEPQPSREQASPQQSNTRHQREQFEWMQLRAARVAAN
jgi:hypothetical protein